MFEYLGLIIACVYLVIRYFYSHWERKKFPFIKPVIPFGNLRLVAQKKRSFGTGIYDLYTSSKEPFVGIYLFWRPAILIRDAELAKTILVKDFASFHDRGVYVDEKNDPMSGNLFALKGERWKKLRQQLTPTFTSGKLKNMMPTIMKVANELQDYLRPMAEKGEIIEMKDLMSRYVIDIIASVIFGCEVNSIRDPEEKFRSIGKPLNTGYLQAIRSVAIFLCPSLIKITGVRGLPKEIRDFCISLVKNTIEHREKSNETRKDFMQLLLQLRNTGEVGKDGEWDVKSATENKKTMTIEQCAAQVFVMYVAGFESSSATTSFCMYELCKNPALMKKLQDDIQVTLAKHGGAITYESIQDMKYLELCFAETVRKYPALPILNRECTKDYQIPESNFTIEKGTSIIISLMGMHRDAKYFPEPDKFDPGRFAEETKNYDETAYMPFGEGPRSCVAFRLGKIIVKAGLVMMLQNFEFELTDDKPLEFNTQSVALDVVGGINFQVRMKK